MTLAIRQTFSKTGAVIFWPGTQNPKGGLICLHGSEGGSAGWNHLNCALFAANGFVAMAQPYTENGAFGEHPDIDGVPLDEIETAFLEMKELMQPFRCGTALYGVSRGAELALLLAQLLAEDRVPALPAAVACHAVPEEIWGAYIVADFRAGQPGRTSARPAWTWRGQTDRTQPGTLLRPERFPNPIFIAHGMQDKLWDPRAAERLVERMAEAGRRPEAHFFLGEGHNFRSSRNLEMESLVDFLSRHLAPKLDLSTSDTPTGSNV